MQRLHLMYGNVRLILVLFGAVVGWLVFGAMSLPVLWFALPIGLFLALAVRHDRLLQQKKRAERAVTFYQQGLRRLQNAWTGTGTTGIRFDDPAHPYARDLDIFGRGSLYELLCTARTSVGESTLARWLSAPASPAEIRARQAAVAELRPRLDLREDLAVRGEAARDGVEANVLAEWGNQPAARDTGPIQPIAFVLAAFNLAAAGAWLAGYGYLPLLLTLALGQVVTRPYLKQVRQAMHRVERPGRDLALLSLILERLETETFESPLLVRLLADLNQKGSRASARIARLQRLTELLEMRGNIVFALIDSILLFTFQVSLQIEAWRKTNGPQMERWLAVTGEFEALSALAGYAFEHPADPFPEIIEGDLFLQAEHLAHPLLPGDTAVANSIRFDAAHRLYIVSGSNMSGKSTFLRTLGTNVVLALAGATVRAESLKLSPVQIGASLQTNDSLQAGISRFYAELLRLHQIVELASGELPLLFLLDEILHGTNSHDRLIGAEAILRTLVARDAIGLATTHDLALARIVEDAALRAANIHFEDQITDGKMSFDYHLRSGVVAKSNALELMRAVGLDV